MTKASQLRAAEAAGLAVPKFMVISATLPEGAIASQLDGLLAAADLQEVVHFSVRSSADVEDGESLSFAGQFETFLHVHKSDLLEAIIDCRESANSEQVAAYANNGERVCMDVMVQEMIDADISGVGFSANPNGMLNEAVLVVGAGAGTVVADEADTTSYYYHLDENVYHYDQVGDSPLLSPAQLHDVVHLLRQCMAHYGRYIDIEFALKDDVLWLLQVRPITTIATDDIVVFDDHNIIESYPGVVSPLTQSFVTAAYSGIFGRLLERALGVGAAQRYQPVVARMVRAVNGRMYYQVSSWYTILSLLPFRRKILRVWQEMVGVDISSIRHEVNARLRDRMKISIMILTSSFMLPRQMKQLHEDFLKTEQRLRTQDLKLLSTQDLINQYDTLTNTILHNWDITLSNDMYTFVYTALYKWRAGEQAVLRTDRELPSTRLVTDYQSLVEQLATGVDASFDAAFTQYCLDFGDRVPGELKLEVETFRQSPSLLMAQLKAQSRQPHASKSEEGQPSVQREGLLARHFHARAASGVYNRELSRLDRAKIFGMVREIMLCIGAQLAVSGDIADERDIFYLNLDEIRSYEIGQSFIEVIALRKERHRLLELLPAYSRLVYSRRAIIEKQVGVGMHFGWAEDTGALLGIACSPGVVEGEALVVGRMSSDLNAEGKILVAETTDPGWVFLLTQAKGVIAERGSLLSHTAIVSRELHKPSVVGVIGATRRIKTGDMIRLNGSTGEVDIIS